MEVEEKVENDLTVASTEIWTAREDGGTSKIRCIQTFARVKSKDSDSMHEPDDAVTLGNRSDWDGGEEGVESGSECLSDRLEGSVCQKNNTTSVIVGVQGSSETEGDPTTVCCAEEKKREEVIIDNQSGKPTIPGRQTPVPAAEHPGKVIVTEVTINSLTVTFQEASVADGFFKCY